ncbi:MAG: flavodoxin [Lautropia sp.]|nr:flavodoxin [Lautropia sp.]
MKEVIILIGIGPATETVARQLGSERQLVLADLQTADPAATGQQSSDQADQPRQTSPAEALAKVLRRAGIKSRSTRVDLSSIESIQALCQFAERLGQPSGSFLLDPVPGAASPLLAIDLTATGQTLAHLPPLPRSPGATPAPAGAPAPEPATPLRKSPAQATQPDAPASNQPLSNQISSQRACIVCFSASGNTETIAWMIQKYTNADVSSLKPLMLYPRDYKNALEQVKLENELSYLPKLGKFEADIGSASLIYLGFPVWDGQLPPPVKTWLSQFSLAGKIVAPFCTHGGSGTGQSFQQISEICPDCTVQPGLAILGNADNNTSQNAIRGRQAADAERQVQTWLGA